MMPVYSLPFSISAIAYLDSWRLGGAASKNKVQQLYGVLCIATCLWQGLWAILFAGLLETVSS